MGFDSPEAIFPGLLERQHQDPSLLGKINFSTAASAACLGALEQLSSVLWASVFSLKTEDVWTRPSLSPSPCPWLLRTS